MKVCRDPHCLKWEEEQPLELFPVNRDRRDGRHTYCLECCRRKSQELRDRKRALQRGQVSVEVQPVRMERATPERKAYRRVLSAVRSGHSTRADIQQYTQLDIDDVCDALATLLLEDGLVRLRTVNGERRFVA